MRKSDKVAGHGARSFLFLQFVSMIVVLAADCYVATVMAVIIRLRGKQLLVTTPKPRKREKTRENERKREKTREKGRITVDYIRYYISIADRILGRWYS